MKFPFFLIPLSLLSLVIASSADAQNKGTVAVVDLDAVAKELGFVEAVTEKLKTAETNVKTQLANAKGQLQGRMDQAEAQLKEDSDEKKRQDLINFKWALNQKYDQLQLQARQALTKARAIEVNKFREALKPVAMETAKTEGFQIILMKGVAPVYAATDAVDITKQVTAAAKKAGIKPETVIAPVEEKPEDVKEETSGKKKAK